MKFLLNQLFILLFLVAGLSLLVSGVSHAQQKDSSNIEQLRQLQESVRESIDQEQDTFLPEQKTRLFEEFSPDFGLTNSVSVFQSNYDVFPLTVTNDLKFYLSFFFSQSAFFYARGRNRTTWNSKPRAGQKELENVIDLDKLYFQIRLSSLELTLGRYQYVLGRGMILNNNGDGFNISWSARFFSLQALLVYSDFIRKAFDSFKLRRDDFSNGSKRLVGAGKFTFSFALNQSLYAGFLYQHDFKSQSQEPFKTYYALLGWDLRLTSFLFFFGEAVYQGGTSVLLPFGSLGPETKNTIMSGAVDSNIQFRMGPPAFLSVTLNYSMALGDDNTSTFIGIPRKVQGKNSFESITRFYTGFSALFPSFTNLHLIRLKVDALPFYFVPFLSKMYGSFYYNVYLKQNKKGISPISIADQDESFMGQSLDFLLYWRILSDLTLSINSGVFIPGKAISDKSVKYMVSGSMEFWF